MVVWPVVVLGSALEYTPVPMGLSGSSFCPVPDLCVGPVPAVWLGFYTLRVLWAIPDPRSVWTGFHPDLLLIRIL